MYNHLQTFPRFSPQRRLFLLLPALFLSCLVVPSAVAEGMTSHPWITYLAYKYTSNIASTNPALGVKIKKALDDHQNTLSMASSFPDYFYLPGWMMAVSDDKVQPYRDSSEAAHWPPFQSNLAEYIRSRPDFNHSEWSKETSQAVAQLFGMGSHFAVDLGWEGLQDPGKSAGVTYWTALKRGRGFTSFMSAQNWGDSGFGNHNEMPSNLASDTGLPFLGLSNPVHAGFSKKDRNLAAYPTAVMGKLLRRAGHDVDDTVIKLIAAEYDVLFTVINGLGPSLNAAIDEFMNEQPEASEELFEYPVGGLVDLGWWVSQVWQRYARWLESGTPFGGKAELLELLSSRKSDHRTYPSNPNILDSTLQATKAGKPKMSSLMLQDAVVPEEPMELSLESTKSKPRTDSYTRWNTQCLDKLRPVEKSLKDFGAIAAKFQALWEKMDKSKPLKSLKTIAVALGNGAADFFKIVSILFECVQPHGGAEDVLQCSGGQKLDPFGTPSSGNQGKGQNCWSKCHSTADKSKWKTLVAQDCAQSGLILANLGNTIFSMLTRANKGALLVEPEFVEAEASSNAESVANSRENQKFGRDFWKKARTKAKRTWNTAVSKVKKGATVVRNKINAATKKVKKAWHKAADRVKKKVTNVKKKIKTTTKDAKKAWDKAADKVKKEVTNVKKKIITTTKDAWAHVVQDWNNVIDGVKETGSKFRYTAKCKDSSMSAAKCSVRTGLDTFAAILTLHANLIGKEPGNSQKISDSLVQSKTPIGFLGHSLAAGDFNGDGIPDLASGAWGADVDNGGAPQSGAVYLSYGNTNGKLESPAILRSSFPYKYGHNRFGWSVVALDFNGDGIDDLAVSSPSAQEWQTTDGLPIPPKPTEAVYLYQGRVEIFWGKKGTGLITKSSTVINTADPTTNLGLVLRALDVNGDGLKDLCIGNPLSSYPVGPNREARRKESEKSCDNGNGDCDINKGSLMVFFSSANAADSTALDASDANIVLNGPRQYDLFASDIAVVDGLLLVGAPGKRIPARKADTKPIRVDPKSKNPMWWEKMPKPAGSIKLPGADTDASHVPGAGNPYDTTGGMYVYEINEGLLRNSKAVVPKPFAILMGQDGLAEFGKQVAVDPSGSGRIVVTSPASGQGFWSLGLRGGGAVVFKASTLRAAASSAAFTLDGTPFLKQDDLDGLRIHGASGTLRRGYLGETAFWTKRGSLILGAPFKSSNTIVMKRQTGAFYVWNNLPSSGSIVDVPNSASHVVIGTKMRQRVGSAIAELQDGTFSVGMPMLDTAVGMMAGGIGSFQCTSC